MSREHCDTHCIEPRPASPYPRVARRPDARRSSVRVNAIEIGTDAFVVIAGPCAVEDRTQIHTTARAVAGAGAHALRGGAYKPRTSPYSFQGLGEAGLELLAEAGREVGLPVVTEVLTPEDIPIVAHYADVLQVGARNMQNFALLKALGQINKPVVLKRGPAATIEEFLLGAEYIVDAGNPNVILCERGIRTFETATRNTLDLNAVAVLKERTHLPVIVDPSHGTGRSTLVAPLAKAAAAAGADGVMVEVHPAPEHALSDGKQSLTPRAFQAVMDALACCVPVQGRCLTGGGNAQYARRTDVEIDGWRQRIDTLDTALVRLLIERARVAQELGRCKLSAGLPIHNAEREADVLSRVGAMAAGPLSAEALAHIFAAVIQATRESEEQTLCVRAS